MVGKTLKALRYIFIIVTVVFLIFILLDPLKTIYFGYLTFFSSLGVLMYIFEMRREGTKGSRLVLTIISCALFLVVSLYIFASNL